LERSKDGPCGQPGRHEQCDEGHRYTTTAKPLGRRKNGRACERPLKLLTAPGENLASQARDNRRDFIGCRRRASLFERVAKPRRRGKAPIAPALERFARDGIQLL
jgi:hypothetical protein